MRLSGQIAIITGATSGIGKHIALLFAQAGAIVYGIGTKQDKALEVEKIAVERDISTLTMLLADISKKEDVEKVFETVLQKHGKIDILINNAGITRDGLLMKMSDEDWQKVLDINLSSSFYTCRQAIRPMMKARSGVIINITSVVGLIGNPGQCNYAASKAGMIGFSKALAKEVASRNIRVNCIAPGFIETDMTHALGDTKKEQAIATIPMGRMGKTDEIAHAALYLATDATYMTGQTLVLDGGLAM